MEKVFKKIEKLGGVGQNPGNTKPVRKFDFSKSVKTLEDLYQAKLPGEYVQLQKKYGGFSFNKDVVVKAVEDHPVLDDEKLVSINFFYGLEPEGENSIYNWIRSYKDRIPGTLLPIAEGELNDLVCIDLGKPNYGRIYYWVSEVNASEEKATFLLANSLMDLFLNAFVEEEEKEGEVYPEVNWEDEKYKKMKPELLKMLKKFHEKENKKQP